MFIEESSLQENWAFWMNNVANMQSTKKHKVVAYLFIIPNCWWKTIFLSLDYPICKDAAYLLMSDNIAIS